MWVRAGDNRLTCHRIFAEGSWSRGWVRYPCSAATREHQNENWRARYPCSAATREYQNENWRSTRGIRTRTEGLEGDERASERELEGVTESGALAKKLTSLFSLCSPFSSHASAVGRTLGEVRFSHSVVGGCLALVGSEVAVAPLPRGSPGKCPKGLVASVGSGKVPG